MGSRLRGNDRGMIVAARVDAGGTQSARIRRKICWCRRADLNRQPIAYEAIALPLSYCGPTRVLAKKPAAVEAWDSSHMVGARLFILHARPRTQRSLPCIWWMNKLHAQSAPLPNQTPACRGLVT